MEQQLPLIHSNPDTERLPQVCPASLYREIAPWAVSMPPCSFTSVPKTPAASLSAVTYPVRDGTLINCPGTATPTPARSEMYGGTSPFIATISVQNGCVA